MLILTTVGGKKRKEKKMEEEGYLYCGGETFVEETEALSGIQLVELAKFARQLDEQDSYAENAPLCIHELNFEN
jgi:hypothetical protein